MALEIVIISESQNAASKAPAIVTLCKKVERIQMYGKWFEQG